MTIGTDRPAARAYDPGWMKEGIEMASTMRLQIMVAAVAALALLTMALGGFIRGTDASLRNPAGSDPVGWTVIQVERSMIPS